MFTGREQTLQERLVFRTEVLLHFLGSSSVQVKSVKARPCVPTCIYLPCETPVLGWALR